MHWLALSHFLDMIKPVTGKASFHWEGTDCSCCRYSGLEDRAWAELWKWQQSMAKWPNTQTHAHTDWEKNGVAKNTQGNESVVSLSSSCFVACSHAVSFSWLSRLSTRKNMHTHKKKTWTWWVLSSGSAAILKLLARHISVCQCVISILFKTWMGNWGFHSLSHTLFQLHKAQ